MSVKAFALHGDLCTRATSDLTRGGSDSESRIAGEATVMSGESRLVNVVDSDLAAAARLVCEGLIQRFGWIAGPAASADISLLSAETAAQADEILAALPPAVCRRTILLGVEGAFESGNRRVAPGTLPAVLEHYQVVGAIRPLMFQRWRNTLSGFIGRKDLMTGVGTTCFKAFQSPSFCDWVDTPGTDVVDFIRIVSDAMRSTET